MGSRRQSSRESAGVTPSEIPSRALRSAFAFDDGRRLDLRRRPGAVTRRGTPVHFRLGRARFESPLRSAASIGENKTSRRIAAALRRAEARGRGLRYPLSHRSPVGRTFGATQSGGYRPVVRVTRTGTRSAAARARKNNRRSESQVSAGIYVSRRRENDCEEESEAVTPAPQRSSPELHHERRSGERGQRLRPRLEPTRSAELWPLRIEAAGSGASERKRRTALRLGCGPEVNLRVAPSYGPFGPRRKKPSAASERSCAAAPGFAVFREHVVGTPRPAPAPVSFP